MFKRTLIVLLIAAAVVVGPYYVGYYFDAYVVMRMRLGDADIPAVVYWLLGCAVVVLLIALTGLVIGLTNDVYKYIKHG